MNGRIEVPPGQLATAFNEWMRRYTHEPGRFQREWQAVREFLADRDAGKEPSYGATCEAYLRRLLEDLA